LRRFIHATSRSLDDLTGHIGRLYLHIEAIFVFDPGLDHWSAALAANHSGLPQPVEGADRCQN
jgi:hypothetical protein